MTVNLPIDAWTLQVYLRDRGLYLWLGPSDCVYGGFAAYVERYHMMAGRVRITDVVHATTVQDAARMAAEQACDLSGFEAWRESWEQHAVVEL